MKLGRIQKRYVAVIILATALISSFVTYSFAGSVSNTLTLSAGPYPNGVEYTIYEVSSTYFAKDQNGVVDYYDTDFEDLFQDVLDALPDGSSTYDRGGTVVFPVGVFNFSNVEVPPYVTIIGAGSKSAYSMGTVFFPTENNAPMLKYPQTGATATGSNRASGITLKNIRFNGDFSNDTAIEAHHSHYNIIEECTFAGFGGHVVYAEDCWEWTLKNNYFTANGDDNNPLTTSVLYFTPGETADSTNCNGWNIDGNVFGMNYATCMYGVDDPDKGVLAYPFHNAFWVTNNWFHGSNVAADRPAEYTAIVGNFSELHCIGNDFVYSEEGFIYLGSATYGCMISDNEFSNAIGYMVYFETACAVVGNIPRVGCHTVSNNVFRYREDGSTGLPTDGVIYFDSYSITATGNIYYTKTVMSVFNLIKRGGSSAGVSTFNNLFCPGDASLTYRSENSGGDEDHDGSAVITHYLTGQPDTIIVTPTHAGVTQWAVTARSNTTFTVTYSNSSSLEAGCYWNWYAIDRPS